MSRAAKLAGWVGFLATLLGVGGMSFTFLSIRSPLANGSLASGPEPTAYVVVLGLVAVGAVAVGLLLAAVVEAIVRLRRR